MLKLSPILSVILLTAILVTCFDQPSLANGKPELSFTTLKGRQMSLKDFRGRVVVVNFFATWCGPCRLEVPELVHLQKVYAAKGVQMLGLSLDSPQARPQLERFVTFNKMNYPVAMINDQDTLAFGSIRSIPMLFVLDQKGRITETISGFNGSGVIEDAIEELL